MFTNRYFLGSLGFSLFLHLSLLGAVKFIRKPERVAVALEGPREVSLDDFDPKERPEVTYGSSSGHGFGGGGDGGVIGFSPDGEPGKPGQRALRAIPGYAHSKGGVSGREADGIVASQAPIDPSLYEVEGGGMIDVIRVAEKGSGRVRSTKEILAEPALDMARGIRGTGGGSGFVPGRPGGSGDIPDISAGPGLAGLFGDKAEAISKADMEKHAPAVKKDYGRGDDRPPENVIAGPKMTVFITGQIADRKRLRSGLPRYPQWAVDQGASGLVRVTITVAPDGSVRENVIIEASSGYAMLDDAVKTVVRTWQFAPLAASEPQADQTGTIAIKFVLD